MFFTITCIIPYNRYIFKTTNLTNMKAHKLTKHSCSEERQKCFTLYCAKCDFGTFAEILFTRHLETKKHNI